MGGARGPRGRLVVRCALPCGVRGALPCARLCAACHRVADNAPTVLSLADRGTGAAIRAAPQSKDCVRARLARAAAPLRKGRSAGRARYPPRLARLRPAVLGAAPLAARATRPPWSAQSIRRNGVSGLVGIPPCAIHRRFGGVLRIQPSSRAPVRIRAASPLARCRHMLD